MASNKKRLDIFVHEKHPELSRAQIQELIARKLVLVNGKAATKPGASVGPDVEITITQMPQYVSRAGMKLEHALTFFKIAVQDKICLDAGLSTGGFTDCLLQHGARKVYGIDVGTAQVDPKIAADPRVVVMENTDIRSLRLGTGPLTLSTVEGSGGPSIDLITLDLSFISLTHVLPTIGRLLKPQGCLITLIKPQFELGPELAKKHKGVITDPVLHQQAIEPVTTCANSAGFKLQGVTESPILGGSGNKEFLAYFLK